MLLSNTVILVMLMMHDTIWMEGMLMGAELLLSLLKGFLADQVVHVNVNMWEEVLLQEQGVVLTVVLMVTGPETARLVTGRTNVTGAEKGAI